MPSRPRTPEFSEQAALFAEKIRTARRAKKLSQLKLAEACDLSYRQLQNIEANTNNAKGSADPQPANPKLDTVYLLAAALDLDIAYLVDPTRAVENAERP